MKKLLILAAMASAALVSCVKNEPAPSVTDRQEITFAPPVVGVTTKVDIELPTVYPNTETFGVFARYYTDKYTLHNAGAVYMDNVEVSPTTNNDITAWAADGYYWPKNNGTLTFAAYSPYSIYQGTDGTSVTHTENGIQISNYTVKAEAADVDVLFSERAYDKSASSEDDDAEDATDSYYGVDIQFQHALAAIAFKAKAHDDLVPGSTGVNYTFKITKIELLNVNSVGTFNQGLIEAADNADNADNPSTPVATNSDWNSSTPITYVAYENTDDGLLVGWNSAESKNTGIVSTITEATGKKYANLILLPQTLFHKGENGPEGTEVKVKVTYNFKHSKMSTDAEFIKDNTAEASLVLDQTNKTDNWLRGKRYVYTLTLSLDKIELEPVMEDWVDFDSVSSTADVTEPIDVTVPDQAS
ncbi:MAG: fimbrillin family protein [Bacteroidales bacterium]|nr:fimbrillin family protein [Bacteroidales bacterium]MBQ8499823.1 fimbrillin family protein [Bacteroidales bacterium]